MDLTREGSELQAEGPATENALLASFVLCHATLNAAVRLVRTLAVSE